MRKKTEREREREIQSALERSKDPKDCGVWDLPSPGPKTVRLVDLVRQAQNDRPTGTCSSGWQGSYVNIYI